MSDSATKATCWRESALDPNIVLPFYWERFKAKTSHLTGAEVGGYLLLLLHQWQHGHIPATNTARLGQIMGCSTSTAKHVWKELIGFFLEGCPCGCGVRRNRRMETVRQEQINYRETKSRAGQASAEKRKAQQTGNRPSTDGQQNRPQKPARQTQQPPQQTPQHTGNLLSPISDLQDQDPNTERSDLASVRLHPVRELLAHHERSFEHAFGAKPAKYTGKDAKHAADLVKAMGLAKARALIDALFASRDPFIAKSGHTMGVLMTVQNKLIAEMSGRVPVGDRLDGLREFTRG